MSVFWKKQIFGLIHLPSYGEPYEPYFFSSLPYASTLFEAQYIGCSQSKSLAVFFLSSPRRQLSNSTNNFALSMIVSSQIELR